MGSDHRGLRLRYDLDRSVLRPALASAFVPLDCDEETRRWIDDAIARPNGRVRLFARKKALRFLSDYDANALFDTHDMRVLGGAQWSVLLDAPFGGALLDVGAGDGRVTETLAPRFDRVVTTESSRKMVARLRERGFVCHEVDLTSEGLPEHEGRFDVITLLNVIDRTSRPYTLLERARDLLAPRGRLVVAVPLPLAPHVHVGPRTIDPEERLPTLARTFEDAANALAELVFSPLGFRIVAFTRAPYLCRGGAERPVVHLDAAIFVARPVNASALATSR